MSTLTSIRAGLMALAVGLSTANAQAAITLDTRGIDANGVLRLSTQARQSLQLTGISIQAGGDASDLGGGAYNLPISSLSANVWLLPPIVTPVAGSVAGAVLNFSNAFTGKTLALRDLQIDFSTNSIAGSFVSGGQSTRLNIFNFDVTSPLTFNIWGGISLTESLGNLRMTSAAAASFVQGMGLPSSLSSVLTGIDFGTVQATIRPWFRTAVPSVPEPGTWGLMGMGLVALAWARRSAGATR